MKHKFNIFLLFMLCFSILMCSTCFADDLSSAYDDAMKSGQPADSAASEFDTYVGGLFTSTDSNDKTAAVLESVKNDVSVAGSRVAAQMQALDGTAGANNQNINDATDTDALNRSLNGLYNRVRNATTLIMVFGILSGVLVTLINFLKIAFMPSHPTQRRNALDSIINSVIVIIALSGLTLVMNLIMGTFQGSFASSMIYATDWRVAGVVFLAQYRDILVGVFGIVTMSMILAMAWQFMNLVLAGGNPQKRSAAVSGILITVAATAGVGGIMTVMSLMTGLIGV